MIAVASCEALPIAAESVDMIFADPPYVAPLVHTYQWLAQEAMRVLKPGCFVAAMCGGNKLNQIMRWFDDAGLSFYWLYQLHMGGQSRGITWINGNTTSPIINNTKHILVYSKGLAYSNRGTVGLYYTGMNDKAHHHWGQSVDSHRYYIDCFSKPGDLVLDPFVGGGTTAVACAVLGRRYLVMDIDPKCCDITRKRIGGERWDELPLFR